MIIKNPTLGSDFEMLLVDKENNYVSAVGRIGGSKGNPLGLGEGCYRQEDNVCAEFNIPPVSNKENWIYYLDYCVKTAQSEILDPQGLELVAESAGIYSDDELQSKAAQQFGCSSSYNAWLEKESPAKCISGDNPNLRTAGFHIHVGFDPTDMDMGVKDVYRLMRYFDLYLGVPSILIEPDNPRRELYGEAGDCRFKDLGDVVVLEYRSLGGYMLNYKGWLYDQTIKAIEAFNVDEDYPGVAVRDAINNNDKDLAKELIEQQMIELPTLIKIEQHA